MNYYKELLNAISFEKEYDKKIFNDRTTKLSLHEKVKNGVTCYPLQIKETGYTIGEYPYLIIEIDKSKLVPHQFKSGSLVKFFSNASNDISQDKIGATINYIFENQIKIILIANDLPDWYDMGKLGIELDFDERTYKEMEDAIKKTIQISDGPIDKIKKIIAKEIPSTHNTLDFEFSNLLLNESQKIAVKRIVQSNDISIIHGPPGTGKTTTLIEAIVQVVKIEKQVLVTAPSNTAVDLLVEKLGSIGLNVIRIGNLSRIDAAVANHTLDYLISSSKESAEIKKIKKQADEYKRMASKYKRKFGPEEREQRKLLLLEAKGLMSQARFIEDYLIDKLLNEAAVICCTLIGVENNYIRKLKFKTCFIDEAAQALEPACWIPMLRSEKVVLAGDPFQLPPTVKSIGIHSSILKTTLMERILNNIENVCLLDTQYRMNEKLMGYSNQYFYENKLKAADSVRYNSLDGDIENSLLFIDTAGCSYEEVRNELSESLYNPEEYILLFKHLEQTLLSYLINESNLTVGIIAPYKEQVKYMIENDVKDLGLCFNYPNVQIQTIDSFQGQERDIIYISLVRSNSEGDIGFLKDYRRMNVAMTRAKKKLVVIGDSATIGHDSFYKGFIDYCQNNNAYKSAWEY